MTHQPPADASLARRFPAIACIGGGNMARALIGGWLVRGLPAANVHVADPDADARAALARDFAGLHGCATNAAAAAAAPVWVFAVKPQQIAPVARALAPLAAAQRPLAISVAAGIRAADLQRWLGPQAAIVRAMPNRPALVGAGMTALYADADVAAEQRHLAAMLLEAVGRVVWVRAEAELDAATAVSGSGPAYFFLLVEALAAAGVAQGLAPEVARTLAVETAWGAARLTRESGEDPATLREQVTSKGGTTAAALAILEAANLRDIVARAVGAASARSRELAQEFGRD